MLYEFRFYDCYSKANEDFQSFKIQYPDALFYYKDLSIQIEDTRLYFREANNLQDCVRRFGAIAPNYIWFDPNSIFSGDTINYLRYREQIGKIHQQMKNRNNKGE